MVDRGLIIDGVRLSDKNLYYATIPPVPTPEQDVEYVEIRGRHGELTKKYGYKNIPYTLKLYFHEDAIFRQEFRKVKPFLLNAKKLIFVEDSEVYYKVKSAQINTADSVVYKYGEFEVDFTLDPFMYEYTNPKQEITESITFLNRGFEAQPIITAHCTGTGNVYVNDKKITIKNVNGTITIDSEMMNAYRKADGFITNLNNHMIGDFPVLVQGNNTVSFDGAISKLEIIKNARWV